MLDFKNLDSFKPLSLRYYYTTLAFKMRPIAYPRATMSNNHKARGFSGFVQASTQYKLYIYYFVDVNKSQPLTIF